MKLLDLSEDCISNFEKIAAKKNQQTRKKNNGKLPKDKRTSAKREMELILENKNQ